MAVRRVEITVSEELLGRIDRARGLVPRAAWLKKACEVALAADVSRVGPPLAGVERILEAQAPAVQGLVGRALESAVVPAEVPLPKIAPRRSR